MIHALLAANASTDARLKGRAALLRSVESSGPLKSLLPLLLSSTNGAGKGKSDGRKTAAAAQSPIRKLMLADLVDRIAAEATAAGLMRCTGVNGSLAEGFGRDSFLKSLIVDSRLSRLVRGLDRDGK